MIWIEIFTLVVVLIVLFFQKIARFKESYNIDELLIKAFEERIIQQ